MNGFGFIEYEDSMDARDVVPGMSSSGLGGDALTLDSLPYARPQVIQCARLPDTDGTELKGSRLTVQFARGPRRKDEYGPQERQVPRPRRTIYRMQITGLQNDTSWQARGPSWMQFLY